MAVRGWWDDVLTAQNWRMGADNPHSSAYGGWRAAQAAKAQAEADARRKAEEEARRRQEEEARRRAEEAARRRAEQEAKARREAEAAAAARRRADAARRSRPGPEPNYRPAPQTSAMDSIASSFAQTLSSITSAFAAMANAPAQFGNDKAAEAVTTATRQQGKSGRRSLIATSPQGLLRKPALARLSLLADEEEEVG